jgi:hypothetical protein
MASSSIKGDVSVWGESLASAIGEEGGSGRDSDNADCVGAAVDKVEIVESSGCDDCVVGDGSCGCDGIVVTVGKTSSAAFGAAAEAGREAELGVVAGIAGLAVLVLAVLAVLGVLEEAEEGLEGRVKLPESKRLKDAGRTWLK